MKPVARPIGRAVNIGNCSSVGGDPVCGDDVAQGHIGTAETSRPDCLRSDNSAGIHDRSHAVFAALFGSLKHPIVRRTHDAVETAQS